MPVIDRTAIILDIFADHAALGRGQAPGRAGPARVQPRAHARPLDPPRAARRRHRHQGPGRVPDRDRPPAGARPHRRAQAPPRPYQGHARRDAPERERAHLPTVALAGYTNAGKSTLLNALTGAEVGVRDRLFHTLDPTTRSFEIGGRYVPADGHRRLHPQAAAPARGGVRRDARGGAGADLIVHVADASRPGGRAARDARRRGRGARRDRRRRPAAAARAQQGRPRRTTSAAASSRSATRARCRCRRRRARASSELREAIEAHFLRVPPADGAARALLGGRQPVRAARAGGRAGARGHPGGRASSGPACRPASVSASSGSR